MSLALGSRHESKAALNVAVAGFSRTQGRSYKAKKSNKERAVWVCMDADCKFSVSGREKAGDDGVAHWEVVASNLNHTCSADAKRKRAPKRELVKKLTDVPEKFIPQRTSRDTAQLQAMAAADGVELKSTQARTIVEELNNLGLDEAFAQFEMLEGYVDQLKAQDRGGTYLVELAQVDVDSVLENQLDILYFCPSSSKSAFEAGHRFTLAMDGTWGDGPLKGCFLFALSHDANNQLVFCAGALVRAETKASWERFATLLKGDFPLMRLSVNDWDKGLQALDRSYSFAMIRFIRCVRHMIPNAANSPTVTKKISESAKGLIFGMAKAGTEMEYTYWLGKLKKENEGAAEWFDERKEQFATYIVLQEGYKHFGHVTNNAAEQFNSVLRKKEWRNLPIISFVSKVLQWVSDKAAKRRLIAAKLMEMNQPLTDAARTAMQDVQTNGHKWIATVHAQTPTNVEAEVALLIIGADASHWCRSYCADKAACPFLLLSRWSSRASASRPTAGANTTKRAASLACMLP
jgi:hypothetical protein